MRRHAILVLAILMISAVAAPAEPLTDDEVVELATDFAIQRLGRAFVDSYLVVDEVYEIEPGVTADWKHRVTYSALLPGKPYATLILEIYLDEQGNVSRYSGVPDCVADPKECTFPIDDQEAKALAIEAGLKPGTEYIELLSWDYERDTFIWLVSSRVGETEFVVNYHEVLLDANDGTVYELRDRTGRKKAP